MIYRLELMMTKLTHQMCLSKLYSTKKPIGTKPMGFCCAIVIFSLDRAIPGI